MTVSTTFDCFFVLALWLQAPLAPRTQLGHPTHSRLLALHAVPRAPPSAMSGRASLTAGQAGLYDAFDALAVQQKTGKLPEATLVSWVKDLSESKLGVFNKQMLELAFPDRESILRLEADIKSPSVESYYGSSLTVTFCHVLRTVQGGKRLNYKRRYWPAWRGWPRLNKWRCALRAMNNIMQQAAHGLWLAHGWG